MDADEQEIFRYLTTWGNDYVSAKEICRRASSKKRYNEENDWARQPLVRMAERGIVESDSQGRYRIKPDPKHGKHKRWVSPDISKILNEGGVEIDEGAQDDIPSDEPQEQL